MSEIDKEDEMDAVNEIVFGVLGEDHQITRDIKAEEPVLFTDVIIAMIGRIDERLKLIEERKVH